MTYLDSKRYPGQRLTTHQLYAWYEFSSGELSHAFRGNGGAGIRSVCGWQRWSVTMLTDSGSDHCRDCTVVVQYELAEAEAFLHREPEPIVAIGSNEISYTQRQLNELDRLDSRA